MSIDWKPIATAPQGQKVLLYYPSLPGARGSKYDHPEMWSVDYPGMTPRQPTHWALLSRPKPEMSAEDEGAAHRCAASPLTARCPSAVGLSYDPRNNLSTLGALIMEH